MQRNSRLIVIVTAIVILLFVNVIMTYFNNRAIIEDRARQEDIAMIKREFDNIGKSVIHPLDIGLRGYAVTKNKSFISPLYDGIKFKDSVFNRLEISLTKLGYDDSRLEHLRDSLDSYIAVCLQMEQLIEQNQYEQFKAIYERNYGNSLWGAYQRTEKHLIAFLDSENKRVNDHYEKAIAKNLILELIIFAVCVPTLFYTAFHTNQVFRSMNNLRRIEIEKYHLIEEQNQTLERKVLERTREIELKNSSLEGEVLKRTAELSHTNDELLEQNSKLEQFAFTVAHNLRAPLTRILGLANVIEISKTEVDQNMAIEKMVYSARELDTVVRDLNSILENSRRNSHATPIDIRIVFERVLKSLHQEIEDSRISIRADVEANVFHTIAPYFESVLFNLVSNAIKYRNPQKTSYVSIRMARENDESLNITVADNGLGIDLEKFGTNLFGLYRRFHTHVEGKGLGLYLVKSQVLAMRGKVTVDSKVGEGTTFSIRLEEMI